MQLYRIQNTRNKNIKEKKINRIHRLYELQQNFVCNFKPNETKPEYNALEDIHTFQYFSNKPVQKHLKRLSKVLLIQNSFQVISILPQTDENKKIKNEINHIIEDDSVSSLKKQAMRTKQKKNQSELHIQPSIQSESSNLTDLSRKQKKEIYLAKLLDPYADQPNTLLFQKRKKLKKNLERLKVQSFSNPSKSILPKIKRQTSQQLSQKQSSKRFLDKLKIGIKIQQNQEKNNDKISKNNQNQHEKLLNLITKKKSEINKSTVEIKSAEQHCPN